MTFGVINIDEFKVNLYSDIIFTTRCYLFLII